MERAGAWLFSDEMYRGLEYDVGDRLPPGCELGERVLTLSGLSKTYGLPGLRCGWLAVRDDANGHRRQRMSRTSISMLPANASFL